MLTHSIDLNTLEPYKRVNRIREVVDITMKYQCTICGYIYDPEKGDPDSGIAPQTPFEDLPDTWVCPQCGAAKDDFKELP
jgi:rubredoxin